MAISKHLRLSLLGLIVGVLSLSAEPAHAEREIIVHIGGATTADGDVRMFEPGVANLRFHDVRWTDESLRSPPYYGARFTYWSSKRLAWGIGLDYSHPKMIFRQADVVQVTGIREGQEVSGLEPLSGTFGDLRLSHGHNLLILTGLRRWRAKVDRNGTLARSVRPHLGFGLGLAIPHAEVSTTNSSISEYQIAGPAAQVLGGVIVPAYKACSFFAELKVSYARIDVAFDGGGSLEVNPITGQLALGVAFSF